MTTCGGNRAEVLAEDYLRGTLPEAEAQSFEEHYLVCNACFEHVRALQAARSVLEKRPANIAIARIMPPPAWAAIAVAAAAIVIVTVAFHWLGRAGQPAPQNVALQAPVEQSGSSSKALPEQAPTAEAPKPAREIELASLADRTLPPFHPTQVRGASEDEHFEAGMRAYAAKDCKTAVDELRRVPRSSTRSDAAVLYAGACNYKLRDFGAARASLAPLANDHDSPLAEAAQYYLAQVELARDDSAAAQRRLKEVVALHGDYETRARVQLERINSVTSR